MLCQCPVHSQKLLCNGLLVGQPSLNGLHTLPNMSSSLLLHLTNYFTLLRGSGVQIRYPHWWTAKLWCHMIVLWCVSGLFVGHVPDELLTFVEIREIPEPSCRFHFSHPSFCYYLLRQPFATGVFSVVGMQHHTIKTIVALASFRMGTSLQTVSQIARCQHFSFWGVIWNMWRVIIVCSSVHRARNFIAETFRL